MRHFQHCYAYEGSFCSCGAFEPDGYEGDQPGPDMVLPPAPFSLTSPPASSGEEQP